MKNATIKTKIYIEITIVNFKYLKILNGWLGYLTSNNPFWIDFKIYLPFYYNFWLIY